MHNIFAEPIITALSQEDGNELVLNPASGGVEIFLIDLPVISTQNGPFRSVGKHNPLNFYYLL